MSEKKEKLLLEYLISSPDTFAVCRGIIKPSFFDPTLRKTVEFITEYFDKYHTTPDEKQIVAETDISLEKQEIHQDKIDFCISEIEGFCKQKALEQAILDSVTLHNEGRFNEIETKIKDALLISLNKNLGLSYFDQLEERLERMSKTSPVMSTGWKQVDDLLFGGISRKELLLVSGNSGGGKSVTLANLGLNFIDQGYNVMYISLELSEDIVGQRFDTMISGVGRREWEKHKSEILVKVENYKKGKGQLHVKYFPSGTTTNTIRAYLKEYYLHYNVMPDLLIVDYLDLMYPNESSVSLNDVWIKDKLCSEQLRNVGTEYNLAVATASQLNRSAVGATQHDHSQIAGGISKINTTDVYWSIMTNDIAFAAGELVFYFQKTRNSDGVGKSAFMKFDHKTLRIRDDKGEQPTKLVINKDTASETSRRRKLLDFNESVTLK